LTEVVARSPFKRAVVRIARRFGLEIMRTYRPGLTVETHLRTLLPLLGIECVLDVGGHRGEFGSLLRSAGYGGRIVSFEPSLENAEHLVRVAARDHKWIVRREALGRENGRLALNVTARTPFSSFREPLSDAMESFPGAEVRAQEEVTVRRLDDVIDDCLPRPDSRVFLKLDTQGWDLEVIAGATRSMASVVCLQSEISVRPIYRGMPRYLEAVQVMEGLGFELTGLYPVARDAKLRIVELDCIMIRSSSGPNGGSTAP
jgi:FkbM family methyltransferase